MRFFVGKVSPLGFRFNLLKFIGKRDHAAGDRVSPSSTGSARVVADAPETAARTERSEISMRVIAAVLMSIAGIAAPASGQESETPMVSPILTSEDAKDPWTFAEPETARVTHVALDLTLDFEKKEVAGTATLDVLAAAGAEEVVLDSQGLQISQVTDEEGAPLAFTLGEEVEGKGTPLSIAIVPAEEPGRRRIAIAYSAPAAEALQWLAPEQTAGAL
jgi:leukotriene-A4 hydrolase